MEWIKNTSLVTGLEEQIKGVEEALKTIDGIVTVIDTVNQTISEIVNIINSVGTLPELDVNLTAIQAVQKSIKDLLDNFMNQGLYILPIFSLDINELKGGIASFNDKVAESFTDPYDNNRPIFSDTAYTAGIVVLFDSGLSGLSSVEETFKVTQGLLSMFNMPAKEIKVSEIGIHSVYSSDTIQFTWSVLSDSGGTPADSYVIYRQPKRRFDRLSEKQVTNFMENPYAFYEYIQDEISFNEIKKVGVVFSQETLRFEDRVNNLINPIETGVEYVYFFVRYVGTTVCKKVDFYFASAHSVSRPAIPCSNLKTTPTGDVNMPNHFSCMRDNDSFNREENKYFARLCKNGTNVCSEYTNKQCKFDDGKKCTSSGFTINKSRGYAKNGTSIPIANNRLYLSTYCKNGTNAQVCDGYNESMIYNQGKDPNWQKLTLKSFLPAPLFSAFDFLYSFVDMMALTVQKQDYAMSLLATEITDSATALKNSILQIRNVLESVIDIINIPLPATYTLKIGTQAGGTTQFIDSLKSAIKGPVPNPDAYTTGFVLFYGSNDKAEVDGFFGISNMIF